MNALTRITMRQINRLDDRLHAGGDPQAKALSVCVVIPNYNHGAHLAAAVRSFLSQVRAPDELILVDDGSTDGSLQIMRELAASDCRIRVVANERNIGVAASCNLGLLAATSDCITFAAADDLAYPHYLAEAMRCLEAYPAAALFCAEVAVVERDRPWRGESRRPAVRPSPVERSFTPQEVMELLAVNDHFIVTLTAVYRRTLLVRAGGFDLALSSTSDAYLSKRLALEHGFCFSPQVLARWEIAASGLSRKMASQPERVEAIIMATRQRLVGDAVFPLWYGVLFERRYRFATCRLALDGPEPDWDFTTRIGALNRLDATVLNAVRKLPETLARLAGLSWLTLRLRPFSIRDLAMTALRRRLEPKRPA